MRVVVLGGGQQGSVIATDLRRDAEVTVVDSRPVDILGVSAAVADLTVFDEVVRIIGGHDLAVGALPARLGFAAARASITARRPYVDVAFYEENASDLDAAAIEAGVAIIPDCGLAPGISNLIVGRELATAAPDEIHIKVGGVAADPTRPYGYVITWSLPDLLDEYVRPARIRSGGSTVIVEPLTGLEPVAVNGIGTMEAFYTDGVRTLLSVDVPYVTEKTLRWPGHCEAVKPLVESGKLIDEFDARCREGSDLVVLIVDVVRNGAVYRHQLVDRPRDALTAMARTTALTCAAVARWMIRHSPDVSGVLPLERIGADPLAYEFIMAELEQASIEITLEES